MKKLKAFTLLELLIGMIISSIVISFSYMSYEMIHRQYLDYKEVKKELVEALQYSSVLNNDFIAADKAFFSDDNLILMKENNPNIEYHFDEGTVLRKDGEIVDTFRLLYQNIVRKYLRYEDNTSLLVAFSFDATVMDDEEHFQFSKAYDAETIVNADIQNLPSN